MEADSEPMEGMGDSQQPNGLQLPCIEGVYNLLRRFLKHPTFASALFPLVIAYIQVR